MTEHEDITDRLLEEALLLDEEEIFYFINALVLSKRLSKVTFAQEAEMRNALASALGLSRVPEEGQGKYIAIRRGAKMCEMFKNTWLAEGSEKSQRSHAQALAGLLRRVDPVIFKVTDERALIGLRAIHSQTTGRSLLGKVSGLTKDDIDDAFKEPRKRK